MTTTEKGTTMRVPPSRDGDTPSERTPEPARGYAAHRVRAVRDIISSWEVCDVCDGIGAPLLAGHCYGPRDDVKAVKSERASVVYLPDLIRDPAQIRAAADERDPEPVDAPGVVAVRLQAELADVRHLLRLRSDALARVSRENEALRAQVARAKADALRTQGEFFKQIDMDAAADHCVQSAIAHEGDLRAALATTGEGQ